MKNKVIIFAENRIVYSDLEKLLLKKGRFDFSFQICAELEEFVEAVKFARENVVKTIVVCKNDFIDEIIKKVKHDSDVLNLLFEQAVKLEDTVTLKRMLFLPVELEAEKFIEVFVEKKPVQICSVFGKSVNVIENIFKQFECSYKIITKTTFLHIVYYSKYIPERELRLALGESYCSNRDEGLASVCGRMLNEKDLSISFVEEISGGNVAAKFIMESEIQLKNCHILLVDSEFARFGVEQETIEQKGIVSKESVYEIAKKLLEKSKSDVALAVVGSHYDAERSFVGVGNKEEIHVFSSAFYGAKSQIVENVSEFALFRLLKFLEKKYYGIGSEENN